MPAPRLAARAALPSRLAALRAAARRPGEASFFFRDPHFDADAVKVLPGEWFVHDEDIAVLTTLGSCIAACLRDRHARVGGMNHFMLPDAESPRDGGRLGDAGGRYGAWAMELLINELLRRGAGRATLEAKVFGGGRVVAGMRQTNVGARNTAFVLEYLRTERIPVVARDVGGVHPRRVCFLPASGRALVRRLAPAHAGEVLQAERAAARRAAAAAGSIDLF
ncbi:MAG TPA: chemoreceptor glutamine deamidase CheD [Ideonella sp.]|nr:chemoreceptor glutamine deamidase CheD [Ideonella sp.]